MFAIGDIAKLQIPWDGTISIGTAFRVAHVAQKPLGEVIWIGDDGWFADRFEKVDVVTFDELAAEHGGFYSPPVVLAGTAKKPKARIAFVNDKPDRYILEINGEAGGPYDKES